jgi:hypothetical protein
VSEEAHRKPTEAHDDSMGDAYCFVAMERTTKLRVCQEITRTS